MYCSQATIANCINWNCWISIWKTCPLNIVESISRIPIHAGDRTALVITTIGGSISRRYASVSCHFMNWCIMCSIGETLRTDKKTSYTELLFFNQSNVLPALTRITLRYNSVESPACASISSVPVMSSRSDMVVDPFPCSISNPTRKIWWYPIAHLAMRAFRSYAWHLRPKWPCNLYVRKQTKSHNKELQGL